MATPETVTYEPFQSISDRLEAGRDYFNSTMKDRGFFVTSGEEIKLITVGEIPITQSASRGGAIRMVPLKWVPKWLASRVRTDRYHAYIDCMIHSTNREVVEEMVITLAGAVAQWMMEFQNLGPVIPDIDARGYNSWIENVEFGYSKGYVWRIARMDYWVDLQHSYSEINFNC